MFTKKSSHRNKKKQKTNSIITTNMPRYNSKSRAHQLNIKINATLGNTIKIQVPALRASMNFLLTLVHFAVDLSDISAHGRHLDGLASNSLQANLTAFKTEAISPKIYFGSMLLAVIDLALKKGVYNCVSARHVSSPPRPNFDSDAVTLSHAPQMLKTSSNWRLTWSFNTSLHKTSTFFQQL